MALPVHQRLVAVVATKLDVVIVAELVIRERGAGGKNSGSGETGEAKAFHLSIALQRNSIPGQAAGLSRSERPRNQAVPVPKL